MERSVRPVGSVGTEVSTELLSAVLRRPTSMLADDLLENNEEIRARVGGARILVCGAAGSIGSSFVRQVADLAPAALHVVDVSENNLVELVRDLRSSPAVLPDDFRALPLPMGSHEFRAFLTSERPYDFTLNFAAVKHVRSEKDPFSLMHMLHTNVLSLRDLLDWSSPGTKLFSISSDKAVNPENAMGASKALMERLMLAYSTKFSVSSTRFANVAFSDGSLLHSFSKRVAKGQPLSAPLDVQRYFISHEEAGQLCLLAGFLGGNREIFVPRLDPATNLLTFAEIAELYLESIGFHPFECSTEAEAKRRAQNGDSPAGTWPCFFFNSDTTGEKMVEEFVSAREKADWDRFRAVGVVSADAGDVAILDAVDELEAMRTGDSWTKDEILRILTTVVPELQHVEKGRSLDDRM